MKERLLSIDVLRGITIFFMIIVNTPGSWKNVYSPLLHAKWHGCTPTDLVFPFFLFIVGVSMAISFLKYAEGDRSKWVTKVLKRTILIFLVGLILNWFPFFHKNIADLRIFGVLQRIALAFGGAGLLIIFIRDKRMLATVAALILLSYWALMLLGGGADPFSLEQNLATYFDVAVLGESHVYGGFGIPFDPEGIISTIPGISHVLIGYFVGNKILEYSHDKKFLVHSLIVIGTALVVLSFIWNLAFPINKALWTSSYVLLTTGLGTLFLALLMWIIDVKGIKKWTYVFRVFGLNPLASYVLSGLVVKLCMYVFNWKGGNPYPWLYENVFSQVFSLKFGSFLQALCYTLFIWFFAWLLYRKNKVIKI